MTTEFVRLEPAMTVGQALAHIRDVARDRESGGHLQRLWTKLATFVVPTEARKGLLAGPAASPLIEYFSSRSALHRSRPTQ
jgi:hypothetical protein